MLQTIDFSRKFKNLAQNAQKSGEIKGFAKKIIFDHFRAFPHSPWILHLHNIHSLLE